MAHKICSEYDKSRLLSISDLNNYNLVLCTYLLNSIDYHSSLLSNFGFFLQPLPKIHTSHQYLENLEWFVRAVFEAIEVKEYRGGILRLQLQNF